MNVTTAHNPWEHRDDCLPAYHDAPGLGRGWSDLHGRHVPWPGHPSVQWVRRARHEHCKAAHILQAEGPALLSIMGVWTAYMGAQDPDIIPGMCCVDLHDLLRHWLRPEHRKVLPALPAACADQ